MGVMWQDQLNIIEALAKSIPNDWVLYVKEHPGVVTNRIRPYSMYRRMAELPNVVIAPVYENTNTIIQNAEMIADDSQMINSKIIEPCYIGSGTKIENLNEVRLSYSNWNCPLMIVYSGKMWPQYSGKGWPNFNSPTFNIYDIYVRNNDEGSPS